MKAQQHSPGKNVSVSSTASVHALVAIAIVLASAWITMVLALSSRNHLLMNYGVIQSCDLGNDIYEPLLGTVGGIGIGFGAMLGWVSLVIRHCRSSNQATVRKALGWMILGLLPFVLWLLRALQVQTIDPHILEVILVAASISLSFRALLAASPSARTESGWTVALENRFNRWGGVVVVIVSIIIGLWWLIQSLEYYDSFMLGYNDFGHFLQRVANTAAGRGFLKETPVLPAFWDHFNPGLVCLIPFWLIYPQPTLVLVLQAASLAGSALLIHRIAIELGHTKAGAACFGLAWLSHPVVGQMNLAYTYGWHPITFAIPLLLVTMLMLLKGHYGFALVGCLAAMSFEEGVFVIVGLTAGTSVLLKTVLKSQPTQSQVPAVAFQDTLQLKAWFATGLFCVISFILIYRFSGLAQFQTGRFIRLGSSPLEIVLSPMMRPDAFWGQLFKIENFILIAGLLIPCGPAGLLRGWRWLLPIVLPIAVLVIWDHQPAHSLAFHYPSTLLPLVWLATMIGSQPGSGQPAGFPLANAMAALIAGLTLSLFIGQLPYSCATLMDVEARTYAGVERRRSSFAEDGIWLKEKTEVIRATRDECLATGRIAAHLVGVRDIETVGQFVERRQQLAVLPDRMKNPLLHYKWILLDRLEAFQQTPTQTASIESEAITAGFQIVEDRFDLVILKNAH
jgi:uncharacterized membrane protein